MSELDTGTLNRLVERGVEASIPPPPPTNSNREIRNLATAILVQALRDWLALKRGEGPKQDGMDRDQDPREWLFSDAKSPGSFHWVCEITRLDADSLRSRLRLFDETETPRGESLARALRRLPIPH